ncbi:MAG TPA: enolase C-terminal domain-like protein [Rhodanobacteraceae bacterium]|nr:enolase C-terminal domain-like protein [Rhodanobacteraceae bacterium]
MKAVALSAPRVSVYKVPTDAPESDGTLAWDSTMLVLVEIDAGGKSGLGYSYADTATAVLIRDKLAGVVEHRDALDIQGAWLAMLHAIRNLGRPGIASMAISAIDNALWDLKARLLDLPLCKLLGMVRECAPVYGSGGFTSYDERQLRDQLGDWARHGFGMVKMKVGREPQRDPERVAAARKAIGDDAQLFVDANGAYSRKQALRMARTFAESDVAWFEEPVSSDDREGLRLLRDRAPASMDIAAGEYGYDSWYFRRMLQAGAVDVLQADATRCAGITGFMQASALCQAFQVPFSGHCAPSIHAHPACASPPLRHIEYFHDHVRIESMLFDGALMAREGALHPDLSRAGLGLEFKHADARRYAV